MKRRNRGSAGDFRHKGDGVRAPDEEDRLSNIKNVREIARRQKEISRSLETLREQAKHLKNDKGERMIDDEELKGFPLYSTMDEENVTDNEILRAQNSYPNRNTEMDVTNLRHRLDTAHEDLEKEGDRQYKSKRHKID